MKQERYMNADGRDTIDRWADRYADQPEIFRELMWCQMEKYHDRLGKKDSIADVAVIRRDENSNDEEE